MSKYDGYWESKLDAVLLLLRQAHDDGQSEVLDVRGIVAYGERQSWTGRARIERDHALPDQGAAHVTSLAEVLEKRGLPSWASEGSWVLKVSGKLELTVLQAGMKKRRPPRGPKVAGPPGLSEQHYRIDQGATDYTYESIMGRYFATATDLTIVEPYIQMPYQVLNFVRFCATVVHHPSVKHIRLVTGHGLQEPLAEVQGKLADLKLDLAARGAVLDVEWDPFDHNRVVRLDNGWVIKIDRGLDFYQKPEYGTSVDFVDPSLRKCLQTSVDIFRVDTTAQATPGKEEAAVMTGQPVDRSAPEVTEPRSPASSHSTAALPEDNTRPNTASQKGNARTIVLISCVSEKLAHPAPAAELYMSPLFRGSLSYARWRKPRAIYILSARYGLLSLDQVIAPYNLTLNDMGESQIRDWADGVLEQLRKVGDLEHDRFIFLAGLKYRKYLVPHIRHCEVPMEGLSIGKQLQFLATGGPHE